MCHYNDVENKCYGKKLVGFLRLDNSEDEYGNFYSIGIYLSFEDCSTGISILTTNAGNEIKWKFEAIENFKSEKLEGFGYIHEPTTDDTLNGLIGQHLKEIRCHLYEIQDVVGEGFKMIRGEIQAIIFKFDTLELVVKCSGDEMWTEVDEKIEIDKTEYPGAIWKKIEATNTNEGSNHIL
ncbi:MAG: hypothetical protein JKY52_01505 [Flavobacteriales bacterium]|nr:hypothetical protein [Flavobacteriales bacterium]